MRLHLRRCKHDHVQLWTVCDLRVQLPNIKEGRKGIEAAQAFETLWHLVLGQPANDHAVSKCELFSCR